MATAVGSPLSSLGSLPSSSSSRVPSPSPRKTRRTAVAFASPPTRGSRPRGPPAQGGRDPVAPTSDNNRFLPQEDVNYLWKLAAGSVGSGAIIKYGSTLFPEITRPNILEALLMIGLPVIVSVFLLIKESTSDGRN